MDFVTRVTSAPSVAVRKSRRHQQKSLFSYRSTDRCSKITGPCLPENFACGRKPLSSPLYSALKEVHRVEVQPVPLPAQHDQYVESIRQESLLVLEWPSVCRQVACFCSTVMASQLIASGQLPMGSSQEESEQLLRQTDEALIAGLSLKGVFDLRPALEAVCEGFLLSEKQLEGIADTLEAAFSAKSLACQVSAASGQHLYPELAVLAGGILDEEQLLLEVIRESVQRGYITDEASGKLASVRSQRSENKTKLRALMEEQARLAFSKGSSDSRSVSIMRGRFCISIKAGRSGDLPRGSVKVGQSQSGATHYYEPAPAISLNNAEALLEEAEKVEEQAVLERLTRDVVSSLRGLSSLIDSCAALDVAAARAGHARWLQGVRPRFTNSKVNAEKGRPLHGLKTADPDPDSRPEEEGRINTGGSDQVVTFSAQRLDTSSFEASPLHVPGALHPLLLEPTLAPLPDPPAVEDYQFQHGFQEAPAWEVKKSLMTGGGQEDGMPSFRPRPAPKPLDLRVPGCSEVVAITGPNTGGKTVTLKTAGLSALMAKAGLYIPVQEQQTPQQSSEPSVNGRDSPGLASSAVASTSRPCDVHLKWFDLVLADIGDAQSLQQNLSTFSGHIRRVKAILKAATPNSLVLLDEVGSGTDPLEGAALARAILDRLAGQASLTLATTHHAELRNVAKEDPRYISVSMEFDVSTLAPTYRLCWGAAGASNALDIAQALGFDSTVVREARSVAKELVARERNRASHMAAVAKSLEQQLAEAKADLEALQRKKEQRELECEQIQADVIALRVEREKIDKSPKLIAKEVQKYAEDLQNAVDEFGLGLLPLEELQKSFSKLESNIPDLIAQHRGLGREEDVQVGDRVWIMQLSGEGVVEAVSGQYVYVQPVDAAIQSIALLSFSSKRARSGSIKYKKDEIRLIQRAGSKN
ncbi:hypothetical protein CEUSTIGMA_g2253.t1 [Chlamydomonas eustigma]|uniref:DNA mismatch repair proteins mutS family domain-containing protein n=1 Tax=Chlamydomonas eustigma TaxID=1157962 RepID=A0A250WVL6_9CHLO|nr:hypothetical protein CEUSTIGMA_g2253.t1 [Chlamydomonas eustigma]|eukprot:GAX74806.1 hypothetical protein CEUSTIGMA_g2253.t1 [Chlamydomonas eustigma]